MAAAGTQAGRGGSRLRTGWVVADLPMSAAPFTLRGLGDNAMKVQAPGLFDAPNGRLAAVGWGGFLDTHFMVDLIGALLLAAALGALIGYHPSTPRTVDTLEEADMPKVYIMYAFIGAVIGVTVREFGMVIGVVVFGIGGLIRFRTDTGSARDTGRLIAVTLAGLIAGLGLPHFAVITTLFTFVMIYFFDSHSWLPGEDRRPAGRAPGRMRASLSQGARGPPLQDHQ